MRKTFLLILAWSLCAVAFAQSNVYFTNEITAESLVRIFQAKGVYIINGKNFIIGV